MQIDPSIVVEALKNIIFNKNEQTLDAFLDSDATMHCLSAITNLFKHEKWHL